MTLHILLILGIVLFVSLVFVLIHMVLRQLKRRIDIRKYVNGKPVYEIAYVKHSEGKAAEAYLPTGVEKVVGRVSIDKSGEKAVVQLLQSNLEEDIQDPIFKRCGYLGEDGYIYSQPIKNGPVARVGYVAGPSKPKEPCLEGERTWRTLWLHSFLDVYRYKEPYSEESAPNYIAEPTVEEAVPIKNIRYDQTGMSLAEILNDIKRNMVYVNGGTFKMGAEPTDIGQVGEDGRLRGMVEENESPQHTVTLGNYYIARFPVTQAEWKAIMGENPSDCQDDLNYPVSPVSWNQCQLFIQRLNGLTGMQYSLPSEAQWEYAAKGGRESKGFAFSGSDRFSDVGWSDHKHAVGLKAANELGLYDMSGLVREWCSDIWGHYPEDAQTDPVGPAKESPLVIKNPDGELCYVVRSPSGNETVTNRKGEAPALDKSFKSYGFRLVCQQMPIMDESNVEALALSSVELEEDTTSALPLTEAPEAEMIARCDLQGFGFPIVGTITAESRAGAYALFAYSNSRNEYEEFYSEPKYGWKDTALLASVVYVIGYILFYLINTSILQRPLVGMLFGGIPVLYGFYFVVWALIRSIKVEMAESGNSFQPQLDLLNKSLGQRGVEICILVMALLAIPISIGFFEFDFIPMLLAIMTGVVINWAVVGVSKPWRVKKSYSDKASNEPEEDENGELATNQPPTGDISCVYDWDLDYDGMTLHGNLSIRFDSDLIREERQNNPFFSQTPLKSTAVVRKLFEMLCQRGDYMERTRYLAKFISNMAIRVDLPEHVKLQFALDFIQEPNIRFVLDKNSERIQNALEYMRLPDETLFDKEGDYDCKAFFAAMLFYSLGYDVLFLYSTKHEHYAIAVEERYKWTDNIWTNSRDKHKIVHDDKTFVLCETVADHFRVGELLKGIEPEDFDIREYFQHMEKDADLQDIEYRNYDWDYAEAEGDSSLHGMVVLGFNVNYIAELRHRNPFAKPTARPMIQHIGEMVRLLQSKVKYTANLSEIARIVRNKIADSGIPAFRFAMNFVLDPNIRSCKNINSAAISFVRDYVRFPDEVLFDKEGDESSKALFVSMLLSILGYDVLLMATKDYGHWSVAISTDNDESGQGDQDIIKEYNGKKYLICGSPSNRFCLDNNGKIQVVSGYDNILEICKLNEE